jgi:hypothetical protein
VSGHGSARPTATRRQHPSEVIFKTPSARTVRPNASFGSVEMPFSQAAHDQLAKEVSQLKTALAELNGSIAVLKWFVGIFAPIALAAIAWCIHLNTKVAVIESGGDTKLVTQLESPKSPQQLQASLTTVLAQVQTAQAEGKKPDAKKLRNISSAVNTVVKKNPELPEGWRVASALISYDSPQPNVELPDCATITPTQLSWVPLDPQSKGTPPPHQFTLRNCHLNLDAPLPASHFTPVGQPESFTIVCDHCLVTYSGGAIPLLGLKGYVNLIFNNCRFAISASGEPPPAGKGLMEALLVSDDKSHVEHTLAGE